jgi:hypothetical protein
MVFDLMLFDEKVKAHQITTLHLLCGFAFMVTGIIIAVYNYSIPMWGVAILISGITLLALAVFKNKWLISNKINLIARLAELVITTSIAILSLAHQWKFPLGIFSALSAALVFGILWERNAGKPLFVHIDDSGVRLPSTSMKRFIPWNEIEEVVFRYGTLTVDCVNNNLFQWSIKNANGDHEALESYCNNKIEEYKHKRVKDW